MTDAERDRAWKRILAAAKRYDVEVSEESWRGARASTMRKLSGHSARHYWYIVTCAGEMYHSS